MPLVKNTTQLNESDDGEDENNYEHEDNNEEDDIQGSPLGRLRASKKAPRDQKGAKSTQQRPKMQTKTP